MIWAAAYCDVRDDVQPPQELTYARRTDQYGPPYEGGWMNWPAGLVYKMGYLKTVNRLMKIYRDNNKSTSKVRERYGDGAAKAVIDIIKKAKEYGDNN